MNAEPRRFFDDAGNELTPAEYEAESLLHMALYGEVICAVTNTNVVRFLPSRTGETKAMRDARRDEWRERIDARGGLLAELYAEVDKL